jgi:hypothetical protein
MGFPPLLYYLFTCAETLEINIEVILLYPMSSMMVCQRCSKSTPRSMMVVPALRKIKSHEHEVVPVQKINHAA